MMTLLQGRSWARGKLVPPGLALLVATLVGCGNQTSGDELRAMLQDLHGASSSQGPAPGVSADVAPPPTSPEASNTVPSGNVAASSDAATSRGPVPTGSGGSRPRTTVATGSTGSTVPRPSVAPGSPKAEPPRGQGVAPPPATPGPAGQSPSPGPASGGCTGSEPPLVVGSVGTQSGVLGEVSYYGVKALQAWAASVNAAGGINCHKVNLLLADDGADPARHQSLVRQFVEREKVVAFIWNFAVLTGQAAKDYLNEKRVPVVGQEGGQDFFYDSPMHFPIGWGGDPMAAGQVFVAAHELKPKGKNKVAIFTCQEVEFCNRADRIFKDEAVKQGFEVVYTGKSTLTQPDYTAQCVEMQQAGAQVLIAAFDGNSDERIMTACQKINYKPTMVVAVAQGRAEWVNESVMEGTIIASGKRPWFGDQPAVTDFLSNLKKYGPKVLPGPASMDAWATAKAFEHAARKIDRTKAPDSNDVLAGLDALNGDDIDGLVYPLRFTAGAPDPRLICGWAVTIGRGKATSSTTNFICTGEARP